ncbi:MAG: hypothetical protein ACI8PZ_001955 [Myxococcota bacterium]|jgi:hypothetical protein
MMNHSIHTNLGVLISTYFDEFMAAFGDEALASALTAQAVNDLLEAAEAATTRRPALAA